MTPPPPYDAWWWYEAAAPAAAAAISDAKCAAPLLLTDAIAEYCSGAMCAPSPWLAPPTPPWPPWPPSCSGRGAVPLCRAALSLKRRSESLFLQDPDSRAAPSSFHLGLATTNLVGRGLSGLALGPLRRAARVLRAAATRRRPGARRRSRRRGRARLVGAASLRSRVCGEQLLADLRDTVAASHVVKRVAALACVVTPAPALRAALPARGKFPGWFRSRARRRAHLERPRDAQN
jgi:hypothetical protein